MKLTAILFLAFCLQVSAKGEAQTITISLKDVAAEKVFKVIEEQTDYKFAYKWEEVRKMRSITLEVKNVSLRQALDICFKDQPFTYSIVDNIIIISPKPSSPIHNTIDNQLEARLFPIKGIVKNENGQPLAGASIIVKGTGVTAMSDEKGNFEINANEGQVLVISYVGFERQEVRVGKAGAGLNIMLAARVASIDSVQVISTGYQRISRERFVGAVSTLDSASYHRRAGVNILNRLDGTVPGLIFDKKSTLVPIQIRGLSSLGGNTGTTFSLFQPLVVVDNFPMDARFDINSINQNDVENITILKDAAAASMWGTRAGNGVIVITTKKGRYNQPFNISVNSNVTIHEKPDQYYIPQMSTSDFIDVEQFLFNNSFYNSVLTNTTNRPVVSPVVEILKKASDGVITQQEANEQINMLRGLDIRSDLDKYAYQNAVSQQHFLNLSGGSQMIRYIFSAGYNRSMPNIRNSAPDDQYTLSSNASFRPVNNLEIQTGINYTHGSVKSYTQGFIEGAKFTLPNKVYPYMQLADANGNALAVPYEYRKSYLDTAGNGKLLDWQYRPLDEVRFLNNTNTNKFTRLNFNVSYRLTSWLNVDVKYQYMNQMMESRKYYSLESYFARNLINRYTNLNQTTPELRNPVPLGGILDLSNSNVSTHNARGQLNINKSWGDHSITGLLAAEISETKGNSNNSRFYGYDEETGAFKANIDYLTRYSVYGRITGSSTASIPNAFNINEGNLTRFTSFISNVSYVYKNRYTIYFSGRRDGSNVFGVNTNNKWKPLWSTGLSWDISKEHFYNITWMSYLKLRASYGYTGNVDNTLSGLPTMLYSQADPFLSVTNISPQGTMGDAPNPDLKWEEVRTINVGIDFSLFKSRIAGSFDVFNKKSTDLISSVPFGPSSGVSLYAVNAASLKTNGFELLINSKNTTGNIRWETSFALSHAKPIVTKIYNGKFKASDFVNYQLNPAEGKVAYGLSSYRWAGLDPTTGDPQGYLNGEVSKDYTAIFNDSIGNQVFHGSTLPLYFGYMLNAVTWRGITLSANITYRLNFYFRKPSINYGALFNSWISHPDYSLRWQKQGDETFTDVPSMIYPVPSNVAQRDIFYSGSEINVLRGDNIRLQDIRLQYTWNNSRFNKLPIRSVQFFVYVNNLNLILWRKDKYSLDPDFTFYNPSNIVITIPTARSVTGGLSIQF